MILIALADSNDLYLKKQTEFLERQKKIKILFDVNNGEDLLKQLIVQGLLPDIVLINLSLPYLDYTLTTRIIKRNYPSVRIIAISEFLHYSIINSIINAGANGYLCKNSKPEIIREAIDVVYDNKYFVETKKGNYEIFEIDMIPDFTKKIRRSFLITKNQRQFLQLCVAGFSYTEIASKMNVNIKSVHKYQDLFCKRFNLGNRIELILFVLHNSLIVL